MSMIYWLSEALELLWGKLCLCFYDNLKHIERFLGKLKGFQPFNMAETSVNIEDTANLKEQKPSSEGSCTAKKDENEGYERLSSISEEEEQTLPSSLPPYLFKEVAKADAERISATSSPFEELGKKIAAAYRPRR